MNILGRPTIDPVLFFTGKISGYLTWILLAASLAGMVDINMATSPILEAASFCTLAIGTFFTVISLVALGGSTRLGLPREATAFKKAGIYRISRNPMYLGFNLFTIASMLYTANFAVLALGIYSITIYHLIIKGEESFLAERFGADYLTYKKAVRRYL